MAPRCAVPCAWRGIREIFTELATACCRTAAVPAVSKNERSRRLNSDHGGEPATLPPANGARSCRRGFSYRTRCGGAVHEIGCGCPAAPLNSTTTPLHARACCRSTTTAPRGLGSTRPGRRPREWFGENDVVSAVAWRFLSGEACGTIRRFAACHPGWAYHRYPNRANWVTVVPSSSRESKN